MNRNLSLLAAAAVALLLAGCASSYSLTLMPRNSGKLYYGEAVEHAPGGGADISITIENRNYTGTWVASTPSSVYATGGYGWYGRRGAWGFGGGPVIVDNPTGGESKALLQSADGAGLRCDFIGLGSRLSGAGTCQDDQGLIYDVQLRVKKRTDAS